MLRKLITGTVGLAAAVILAAAPASAHVNDSVPGNETRQDRQGGAPFPGFVGPVETFLEETLGDEFGSEIYVQAHSGMECGALRNPNMTALGPAADRSEDEFQDDRFICPSAENLVER